jgi:magnesium transporter
MIALHAMREGALVQLSWTADGTLPAEAIWIDLHNPTAEEEGLVERALGIDVPTRAEMAEIADSARLYDEGEALFMTATVVAGAGERRPVAASVTFVLTPRVLVTVRYADPLPFRAFQAHCARHPELADGSGRLFLSLVGSVVERVARLLEKTETELDVLSDAIFPDDDDTEAEAGARRGAPKVRRSDLQSVIRQLGRANRLAARLRDSLQSIGRMLTFHRTAHGDRLGEPERGMLKVLDRDIRSLAEHEARIAAEIAFLLEATLGLIDIEQNRIIRVFTIAAVIALPPTLIGTVYGMNFETMPELGWRFGYAFALGLMVVSAVGPYLWFRRRGWF